MTSELTAAELLGDVALHLQDLALDSPDVEQFLDDLARYTASRLSSPEHELFCGITLIRRKKATTVASSDPSARLMDETENSYGDGPCLTAMRHLVTVHVPDLLREQRWPECMAAVAGQGVRSILGVPLALEGETRAALNLYCRDPHGFSGATIASAEAYAWQASKSLRLALRMAQLQEARDNMSAAMRSRTVIDLATGAIMAQNRCGQEAAFGILRSASMTRNVKLHEVAAGIVAALANNPVSTYFDE